MVDYQPDSSCSFILETDKANPCFEEVPHDPSITKSSEKCIGDHLPSAKQSFRIMLMNIADDAKKTQLTKVCCLITQAFYKCFCKLMGDFF